MNEKKIKAQCQPLASLQSRRRAYWKELVGVIPTLAFMTVVCIAIGVAIIKWLNAPWLPTMLVAVLVSAPPIWLLIPTYPTEADVECDQVLRRTFGMPDQVEQDDLDQKR